MTGVPRGERPGAGRRGVPLLPGDRGSVTVEFAVVLPGLLLVAAILLAAVGVSVKAVAVADAAAVLARQAARGDASSLESTLAALAPGATASRHDAADLVCVDVRRRVALGPLREAVDLSSRSCAPRAGG
ncbi:pilus assembly protein [Frigoribacterium sp. 2-23]|uniref:pilus assembly protein n=1 Tax=Frigoribacterium sp. 2-23 TaxID=3415006 RepID=UPI003C6EDBB0